MEGIISQLKQDEIARSIVVGGLKSLVVDKNDVTIYFQSHKHGGGEVDRVEVFDSGATALVVFEDKNCVQTVLGRQHVMKGIKLDVVDCRSISIPKLLRHEVFSQVLAKLNPVAIDFSNQDTNNLVKQVAQERGLQCMHDSRDGGFVITGSYEEIVIFHDYFCNLTKDQSKVNPFATSITSEGRKKSGNIISTKELMPERFPSTKQPVSNLRNDGESKEKISKKLECLTHAKPELGKDQPAIKKLEKQLTSTETQKEEDKKQEKTSIKTEPITIQAKNDSQAGASSHEFKINAREWGVFAKTNKEELQQLMSDHGVSVQLRETTCKVVRNPSKECDEPMLKAASQKLANMYNKAVEFMKCERFTLAGGKEEQQSALRKLVLDFTKKASVVLERAPDRQSWEIFGLGKNVDDVLNLLETKVGIRRLKDDDIDEMEEEEEEAKSDANANKEDDDDEEEEDDDDFDPNERLLHQLGNVKISVYKGDITDENSDAIVSATNQRLCHETAVARAIVSKGGFSIQDESARIIATKGELKIGDAVVTHSGKLKCKMVIHAVEPIWDPKNQEKCILQLKMACLSSLQQAEKYSFESISFTAASPGMPKSLCAEAMFDVVEECSKLPKDCKVKDIRFVNNDDKTVKAFQKIFRKRYGDCETVTLNGNKKSLLTKASRSQTPQQLHQKQSSTKFQSGLFPGNELKSSSAAHRTVAHKFQRGDTKCSNEVNQPGKRQHSSTAFKTSDFPKREKDAKTFQPTKLDKDQLAPTSFTANDSSVSKSDRKPKTSHLSEKDRHSPTVFTSYGVANSSNSERHHSSSSSQANGWDQCQSGGDFWLPQYGRYDNEQHQTNVFKDNSCSKRSSGKVQYNPISKVKHRSNTVFDDYGQMQVNAVVTGEHGGAKPKQSRRHHDQTKRNRHEEDQDQKCPICYGTIQRPKTLPKCKHTFCGTCLDQALKTAEWCPLCRSPVQGNAGNPQMYYQQAERSAQRGILTHERQWQFTESPQGAMSFTHVTQPQPVSQLDGTMSHRKEHFSLPGYEDCGTILIQYSLRSGVQGPEHPNPGQRYEGTSRAAYLPDNRQGCKVYKLLKVAFDRGLVFKIGRSMTSGHDNQIVWADIPHKTSINGGPSNYGYPDPTYLTEVQQIIQAMLL